MKKEDIVQKKVDELKIKVSELTQTASNKTMECSSLHKEKETVELENVKEKQLEESRTAEKDKNLDKYSRLCAIKRMAVKSCSLLAENVNILKIALKNKNGVGLKQYKM